ncbi:MAG: hypothetical protein RR835_12270 [Peptostreptococcaceae bacterium]
MDNSMEEVQKSCIELTEDLLKEYKHILRYIKKTEEKLEDMKLEENITTVGSIAYDSIQVSHTYNIGRMTERKALDRVEDETDLNIELYKNKKLKKEIEKHINNLSPTHREILKYRFIDGLGWLEIVEKMNYSERQLIYKKNEAVRSIAIELYGVKVFEEEQPTLFSMIGI